MESGDGPHDRRRFVLLAGFGEVGEGVDEADCEGVLVGVVGGVFGVAVCGGEDDEVLTGVVGDDGAGDEVGVAGGAGLPGIGCAFDEEPPVQPPAGVDRGTGGL